MGAGQTHLGFSVAGETLAVPASGVAEVARVPACTRVPNAPASLAGVANLRGVVLPVVSLAVLLGHAQAALTPDSRLLVLAGAAPVGVLVNRVAGLGPAGGVRTLDLAALLDAAFAGLRRRQAGQAVAPRPSADAAPAPATPLALVGLLVGGQAYALPLQCVAAILRLPACPAHVPGADAGMLGVIAHAGGTLPLVSLAALLGLQPGANGAARVVVATICGTKLGLVVDAVTGTLAVPPDAIDPVPAILTRAAGEAVLDGICRLEGGTRLVGLLSAARLFDADTLARLQAGGQPAAAPGPAPAGAGTIERFVLFRLGAEQYGLPIAAVDEVVRRPDALTWLPHASDRLLGMMALRGRSLPVIDLGRSFGAAADDCRGRLVVVVSDTGTQAGLAVDAVCEVLHASETDLHPAPALAAGSEALFDRVALHHAGRAVLLVSPRAVLAQAARDLQAPHGPPASAAA